MLDIILRNSSRRLAEDEEFCGSASFILHSSGVIKQQLHRRTRLTIYYGNPIQSNQSLFQALSP